MAKDYTIIGHSKKHGNKNVLVSREDFSYLNKFHWTLIVSKRGDVFYVAAWICGKHRLMHRLILNLTDRSICVDHKDRNGLNNTRSNLRIATKSQNGLNRRPNITGTSKYKGVCLHPYYNKWMAQISINGKKTNLGIFDNEKDAAAAYNKAATKHAKNFAHLNTL